MPSPDGRYRPLADYGVIGDCRTMALVSRDASIDWWCQPRFDAPFFFGRLLDAERGGSFHLEGRGLRPLGRRYLPSSAVLETRLSLHGGEVEVTDFQAVIGRHTDGSLEPFARQKLVRMVRCTSGRVRLHLVCRPRPDYGRQRPQLRLAGPAGARRSALELTARGRRGTNRHPVVLHATRAWGPIRDATAQLAIELDEGERVAVVIDYGPGDFRGENEEGHPQSPGRHTLELGELDRWLEETLDFWQSWSSISKYRGEHAAAVERSAITLKLLTYHPSGAIVAAGTSSLPEELGGSRNWDYRFSWLRDSSFTLFALTSLGYRAEAAAFMAWLATTCGDDPDPRVLYRVDGSRAGREHLLRHLDGYRGSRPVRAGNRAASQRQLDLYGGVLDAAYLAVKAGDALTPEEWHIFSEFADLAAARWAQPDDSIWEVRGGRRQFIYSKVLCWVALDRAMRLAELTGRAHEEGERIRRWQREAGLIRRTIRDHGMRDDGAFAQSYDSQLLDAAALLFPLVGYADVHGGAARATLAAVSKELADGELVRRYEPNPKIEGVSGQEGHFMICAFWLCDNLAIRGEVDEARSRYLALLEHANDLGIFAEEWDGAKGIALGNLPQALTHLAVISTAHNLERAQSGRSHGDVRGAAPPDDA